MVSRLAHFVSSFLINEDGPTAVEYALMLALIIVVCMSAVSYLGSAASNTFQYVGNVISAKADGQ
jgi:pilus assembly protein Flp/PilA